MESKIRRYAAVLAALVMGLCAGLTINVAQVRKTSAPQTQAQGVEAGVEKYQEIMNVVDQYFIGDDVDMTKVNDAMASGVITGLGDRWSYYVSAEDYQSYLGNISNSYVGVGITITAKNDDDGNLIGYEVTNVSSGGSAEEAGVLAGDILTQVDGTSVTDISLSEVKSMVLQDLKDQPLLCLDQRTGLYNLCTSLCLQAGFQPDFVYTGHRPENIVGLAAQNMGVALLMQRHTDYVHLQDVVTIDVSPRVESTICLVRQKVVHPSRMGQSFWDFVKALAAQER